MRILKVSEPLFAKKKTRRINIRNIYFCGRENIITFVLLLND